MLAGCSGGGSKTTTSTGSNTGGGTGTSTTPTNPQTNPVPTIGGINPLSVVAGSADTTVVITGTNFLSTTTVTLNGIALKTTYLTATTIQVVIPASALAAGQEIALVVTNPNSDTTATPTAKFTVMSPTPHVTGLTPNEVPQGADATITVKGSGFEANSVVMYNGEARTTTFVDSNTLRVTLTAKDVTTYGSGQIAVYNPGPGGSTTTPTQLTIAANRPTITSVSPSSITATTTNVPSYLYIYGSGFATNATVQANGTTLSISSQSTTNISASLPSSFFASPGNISIVVTNPGNPVVQSNAATIKVSAPIVSMTISPTTISAGSPDQKLSISSYSTTFYQDSVVKWNDIALSTTYVGPSQLTATVPAALLATLTQAMISVSTPETQGQAQPPAQPFMTYLPLATNDIVYNKLDGLLYASIPSSVSGGLGNTVSAIDPGTGTIMKTISVGSEPTRLALSSDGKILWVGLNGASAVRQVDIVNNVAGLQFSLGSPALYYSSPIVASDMAAVPGQPNSVAVSANNGSIRIYDSGVMRAKTSADYNLSFSSSGIAFGPSATTLYVVPGSSTTNLYRLSLDSTGVSAATALGTTSNNYYYSTITAQYDNGLLYTSLGTAFDITNGQLAGQFSLSSSSTTTPTPATGPMVSDSSLGRAWIVTLNCCYATGQVLAYDEATYNPVGSIPVPPISSSGTVDLVRWGKNGLAFRTSTQLFALQSSLVKDVTSSPADLAVSVQGPASATTGTPFSYTLQVANQGPNAATGVSLTTTLPSSLTSASFTATGGTCTGSQTLYCSFGDLANGSSGTVTITATPTAAQTLSLTGYLDSSSYDPTYSNNQSTASVPVTGNGYAAVPYVSQLTPNMVQMGATGVSITVDGSGFTSASTVLWNGQPLSTTYLSSGQLLGQVSDSMVSQIGWASISVTTPGPGGGQSTAVPLHIYQELDVPANAMTFNPYTRKLYAVLPSTSQNMTGNSVVTIDPFGGSYQAPVSVGSEPNLVSTTSDGNYLMIGLNGAKKLARFNLNTQTVDASASIVWNSTNPTASTTLPATGLATLPGSNTAAAVATTNGVGIFDLNGSSGAFRSLTNTIYASNVRTPIFASPSLLYLTDTYSASTFARYSIDASGLTLIDNSILANFSNSYTPQMVLDSGLVFSATGAIANPATTPPSLTGTLPLAGTTSSSSYLAGVTPYQAEKKAFSILTQGYSSSGVSNYLRRHSTDTYTPEDQLQLPPDSYSSWSGVRFGEDGLAILITQSSSYSSTPLPPRILLLRGPFILPAEATANSAPSLASVNSTTIAAGSGNQTITLTGSGFMAGANATWNGAARTTTFIDATHVQVAIPASDVTTAVSATVKVANPGSGDSNSLTVTVQ